MTSEQQIENQLQEEFDKYYNSVYEGKISVPENILDLFKKGVMSLAPQYHKINSNKLYVIAVKGIENLTNGDLRDVITIILNTPLEKIYSDFNEAMVSQNAIQTFIICYNNCVDDFSKKQQMKKVTLQNLAGVRNNQNGLKLVN